MSKEILLTQGKVAIVDDEDYEWLNQYKWHYAKRNGCSYAAGRIKDDTSVTKRVLMHRAIMDTPEGMDTDHINGNGLDNQKRNLRIVSHIDNMKNIHRSNGLKGVTAPCNRQSFWSYIQVNGKRISLGYFASTVAAACAYDYAAKEYFGEFACLNFPDGQPLTKAEVEDQGWSKRYTSQYRGVYFCESRGTWKAQITANYIKINVGTFRDEVDAARAYNEFAIRLHGSNAKLNKIV